MNANEHACHICRQVADADAESIVLRDERWIAYNVADVPGWTMLATREHIEGARGLTEAHALPLGGHIRALGTAVADVTGADRVHVVHLGDTSKHFHIGFFPRQAGEAGLFDNNGMPAEVAERRDVPRARTTASAIRAAVKPEASARLGGARGCNP
jgi:diadenosine tetraphosphate (Ap4A) HIT family hydrolase